MAFTIRPAARSDADRIAPLFGAYRQFYGRPPDLDRARAFIRERLERSESVIFLAEDDSGRTLGFVQLFPSFTSVEARRLWVLNDLFVAADARGLGVGRALMNAAREHAVRTGAKRLTLETMDDNPTAWKLYESLGYVRSAANVRYYTLELD
jgi:ribosomal protein S18 acetylase RimI-like enzyme